MAGENEERVDGQGGDNGAVELSAEEQAAIDRGDVFTPEPEKKVDLSEFDPEVLKRVVGDEQVADPAKKEDEPFIPKARLDELSQQVKQEREKNAALEARLEALEQGKPLEKKEPEVKVDSRQVLKELREQHRTALLEGDTEAMDTIEDQMDSLRIQIAKEEINGEQKQTAVATSLEQVSADAFKLYPFLDNKSETADPDAINAVISHRDFLASQGMPIVDALKEAIAVKGPRFAKLNGVEVAIDTKANDGRDAEALKRAANASVQQPAALTGRVVNDNFSIDINQMTDKQYLAQPEEVKAKLRGDVL